MRPLGRTGAIRRYFYSAFHQRYAGRLQMHTPLAPWYALNCPPETNLLKFLYSRWADLNLESQNGDPYMNLLTSVLSIVSESLVVTLPVF